MRLPEYDYGANGAYFVTVCTEGKRCILGHVVGGGVLDAPYTRLSEYGIAAEKTLLEMSAFYKDVAIEKYVIMPNHVHLIIAIEPAAGGGVRSPRPTNLLTVIRSFKTMVTRELGHSIWQTSFYDHVIRTEANYLRIWQYIDENPACWAEDEYYSE